jgi:hypothetical protein
MPDAESASNEDEYMKRIAYICLGASLLASFLALSAVAQDKPLGDYARSVRKQKAQKKAAAKEFDNDNLPKTDALSVVGPRPTQTPDATSSESSRHSDESGQAAANTQSKPKTAASAADDGEERQKLNKDWEQKITDQKARIALAERELDVMQREYRLRTAAMYADAGNRLRNQAQWDKEDADYKQKIATKQKALDDAKQQLEDMQEEARKAGAPSSTRE